MSGKKTRHLKGVVKDDGDKVVWCNRNQTFHYRCQGGPQYSGTGWRRLVDSVSAGTAAKMYCTDEAFFLQDKAATLVMG